MADPDPELTARYLAATRDLAAEGANALASAWDDLGSWDEADIARLERYARPLLEAIAQEAAAQTSAYLSIVLDEAPVGATQTVPADWRGPFTWHWRALGEGLPQAEALAAGNTRAAAAGSESVMSTARRAGDTAAAQTDRITGWRRSPGTDACQWCRDVAGQVYSTASAADGGHDFCRCGVTPVLRDG